jgi:hypothetical protein
LVPDSPSPPDEPGTCRFIAAEAWEPGAAPFCGAPVLPGSSYCASHRRLCYIDPVSPQAAGIVIAQKLAGRVPPPRKLKCLVTSSLPEPDEETESSTIEEFRRSVAPVAQGEGS